MPTLPRSSGRLLRTVGNRPWANDSNHEPTPIRAPSSPSSSAPSDIEPIEDTFASPQHSDDDDEPVDTLKSKSFVRKSPVLTNIHGNSRKKVQDVGDETGSNGFKMPKSTESLKRKTISDKELDDSIEDDTPSWMTASQDRKRRSQTGYGSSQTYSKKVYVSRNKLKPAKRVRTEQGPPAPKFKRRSDYVVAAESSSQPEPSASATPTFKKPALALVSQEATATPPSSHPIDSSSPLSAASLSAEDDDDIEEIDLLPSTCPLCGSDVDETFKLDWELEHAAGRRMNVKLQERFCQAHQAHNAQRTWHDRQYPEVDWMTLQQRFADHSAHLQAVMEGRIHSPYRQDLETKVRENKTRTAMHTLKTGTSAGAHVGYFGSRGAKLMTEYILNTFSSKLRRLAAADRLIATKGVSGGVSGYVQSVMVPELAVALVMEDWKVNAKEARQILLESADVGEALNAEEAETVTRISESAEPDYGLDESGTKSALRRLEVLDD